MNKTTEHDIQKAFFKWCDMQACAFPELRFAFAIPNGGHRNIVVATKLKAEGVKAGVPDIFLPVARGQYHGCFIEMKTDKGSLSKQQRAWIAVLIAEGYRCFVCHGLVEAIAAVTSYLRGTDD